MTSYCQRNRCFVFSSRYSERITQLLRDLHWSRIPERIQFRLCVLTFRCLNGSELPNLAESICRTANVEGRCHLRSSTTMMLVVLSVQRLTHGDCAFPVAASRHGTAYHLPPEPISSFISFRQQLKTHLFRLSFWLTFYSHCYYDSVKCPCIVCVTVSLKSVHW